MVKFSNSSVFDIYKRERERERERDLAFMKSINFEA